jgi:hypothetical protein
MLRCRGSVPVRAPAAVLCDLWVVGSDSGRVCVCVVASLCRRLEPFGAREVSRQIGARACLLWHCCGNRAVDSQERVRDTLCLLFRVAVHSEAAHEVGGEHRENHKSHEDGGRVSPARRADAHGAVPRPAAAHGEDAGRHAGCVRHRSRLSTLWDTRVSARGRSTAQRWPLPAAQLLRAGHTRTDSAPRLWSSTQGQPLRTQP